jgi:HrpA-like RNA helicase
VLVFLPGAYEIDTLAEAMRPLAEESGRWLVLPLHSSLSAAEQEKVYDESERGREKQKSDE